MTPSSHPSVSFLRKDRKDKTVATHLICGHLFRFPGRISLTSANTRLPICEANGCSPESSLLSAVAYLLSLKCRRFTFGPRWTAGYQSSSCSQCDIQTQQRRCLPTAVSSHQASDQSRSASVMIRRPAAVGPAPHSSFSICFPAFYTSP